MMQKSTDRRPDETLTSREMEIVAWIVNGASNKLLASELGLSIETIKRHLTNIYDKTGVDSRLGLAAWQFDRSRQPPKDVYDGGLFVTMSCPMCRQQAKAVLARDGATAKLRPHSYGTSHLACPGSRCEVMAPEPEAKAKVQA